MNGGIRENVKKSPSICRIIYICLPIHLGKNKCTNCLAAVLYAITEGKNPWLIHEWVHQQTFLEKLKQCQYQIVKTNRPNKGDVVIWQDENDNIQHAAYCIEENLFLISMVKRYLILGNFYQRSN